MDKIPTLESSKKEKNVKEINYSNNQNKNLLIKQMKGISSVLKGSSSYWKGAFTNLGKNFCSCTRDADMIEEEMEGNPEEAMNLINWKVKEVYKANIKSREISGHQEVNKIENESKRESLSEKENMNLDDLNEYIPPKKMFKNLEKDVDMLDLEEKSEILLSQDNLNTSNIKNKKSEMIFHGNKRNWSPEEDQILMNFVNTSNSRNWKKISSILKNKTAQQCAYRYNKLQKYSHSRKWTRNEDIFLMELIENIGQNWEQISNYIPDRSSEEIKERFDKKLNPNLKRCKFEKEEDELIIQLHQTLGNQWNEISKYFKDRNASMIKNRYYSFLKRKVTGLASGKTNFNNTKNRNNNFNTYACQDFNSSEINSKHLNIHENKYPSLSHQFNIENKLNSDLTEHNIKEDSEGFLDSDFSSGYINNVKTKGCDIDNFGGDNIPMISSMKGEDAIKTNLQFNNNNFNLFNNFNFDSADLDFSLDNLNSLLNSNYSNIFTGGTSSNNVMSATASGNYSNSNSVIQSNSHPTETKNSPGLEIASNFYNEMLIDDSEANTVPKDLHKIDTDSPKLHSKENPDEKDLKINNFNEHYKNVFKENSNNRKNFEPDDNDRLNDKGNFHFNQQNEGNYHLLDKNILVQQYQMLQNVFEKVQGLRNFKITKDNNNYSKNNMNTSTTPQKLIDLGKKLDEKHENLASQLKYMKNQYFSILKENPNPDPEINNLMKSLLVNQIEILIDLIKTTKLKINLIQQIDQESGFKSK